MHIYITQLSQVKLQKNETMLYSLKNQKKQKNLELEPVCCKKRQIVPDQLLSKLFP